MNKLLLFALFFTAQFVIKAQLPELIQTLDINNVKAGVSNCGDMHSQANLGAHYEVPKGSGKNTCVKSSFWIGGFDNSNVLHASAQTYKQYGTDFWPGPLDTISGITNSTVSNTYDKIWKINYTDINDFILNFNNGNVQNNFYTPVNDLLTWPASGAGNYSKNLAPFVDVNNNGIYDPLVGGDYPKIKGDQALYFIFNDNLLAHQITNSNAMNIEVHAMAYAYGCTGVVTTNPELTYTTFYDYKIFNRSNNNYKNVNVGMWSKINLGYYDDDFIGCNVADNYGFTYNGDNTDADYGFYPPAQGIAILKGPIASVDGIDNNNNGIIDEVGEECLLNHFTFYYEALPGITLAQVNPTTGYQYYNYLTGRWKDSTDFVCGAGGYGNNIPTNWVYPGDVNNIGVTTDPNNLCGYWTEGSVGFNPGDRKMILSSGSFDLNAGQMQEVEYAFVTSFDSTSAVNANLLSVAKLKADIQNIKTFYNLTNKPNCLQAITVGITKEEKENSITIYPNPAKSIITISSKSTGSVKINYEIVDVLGKVAMQNENTVSDRFSININDLNSGIYFLRLQVNNSLVVKKFVKE